MKLYSKNNLMIDLETLSTSKDAAIIAIGAARFDVSGITDQFYCNIAIDSAIKSGNVSGSTLLWWLKQSDAARSDIFEQQQNAVSLDRGLNTLSHFISADSDRPVIWGNGATFDNTILDSAFINAGLTVPWRFSDSLCYRTIAKLNPQIKRKQLGTHHNALDDAISQAEHFIEILKS